MSAFATIVRLDEGPVSRRLFARILATLDHRGRDGKNVVWRGRYVGPRDVGPPAALGCQHFWTTDEDRGATQPFTDPASGVDLLFDGRLDNRAELLATLKPAPRADGAPPADGDLALAAYLRWGRRCFERLLGPFALVVYDPGRRRVVCARDALGDRTLYYHLASDQLVIASEASALLRHPALSQHLDEVSLARFFAVEAPLPGATFFADVQELPPGHHLTLENDRLRLERYWSPEDAPPVRYRRDADYVDHFRALLTDSVRCRMRGPTPPAVLMSGGLDSTSVAALAAHELEKTAPGHRLQAISWVFDELPDADERPYMEAMAEHFGLDACHLTADGEWPLRDLDSWPILRDAPWQGLYCRLQDRAYAAARDAGASVLLTGEYGDHLYDGSLFWLRDLMREGRWAESWRALSAELAGRGPGALMRAGSARSALARVLGWRDARRTRPRWLTSEARQRVEESGPGAGNRRLTGVLDPLAAQAACLEVANASRAGIEVRRPYRDRRLVELMLSIPAHLIYRPDMETEEVNHGGLDRAGTKWILRRAMTGILPERVRLRRRISTLLPLVARGLVEREAETVDRILGSPDALWQRWVRSEWLEETFPHRLAAGTTASKP